MIPLRPAHLAFRRHVGPYESVPESLFDELEDWAARRELPGPPVWMGIGHDAPGTTPPEQLRFDAALVVPGPFAPEGQIGLPAPARRSLRRHHPCGAVRHAAGGLRRDLPAPPGAPRLPAGRPAGGRDLPHHPGERALSAEPYGFVFAGGCGVS